jgi:phenylacetate-CoA ligase
VAWPAITGPEEAAALALQYQLERSQWLSQQDLRALQFRQLDSLVRHAWLTVPFYRWQWHGSPRADVALTRDNFERLPLLRRENLQHDFVELKSGASPAAHGAISEIQSAAGMDGPVRIRGTALTDSWQRALALRDHLWHRRDFDGMLAVIRAGVEAGETRGWGPASGMMAAAGRSVALALPAGMDAQLEWLQRNEPAYLLTESSNALALAQRAIDRGIRLPTLREVLTVGAAAGAETRDLCRRAWDVPLVSPYSTGETGCIALQCPEREHYHVQSESVLVEVLDAEERACAPGAVGRIVVTTLHNFALPLVRYETGDYAEAGEPCACGRGLPVIKPILGRQRRAAAPI